MFDFGGYDFGGGFDYGNYATPISSGGFSSGFDYGSYATPVNPTYSPTPDYSNYTDYGSSFDGSFIDSSNFSDDYYSGAYEPGDYSVGSDFNYTGTNSLGDFSGGNYDYQGTDYSGMGSSDGYKASDNYGPAQTEDTLERFMKPRNLARTAAGFIPGPLGQLAKVGMAATDPNPGAAFGKMAGSTLGGILGNAVFPGVGGLIGSQFGGWLGGQAGGDTGGTSSNSGNSGMSSNGDYQSSIFNPSMSDGREGMSGGMEPGRFGMGLAGLYQGQRATGNIRQATSNNQQQQDFANQQAQSLASMYEPNSAYSQQLRQQLERKDAAGGRRSQYGPREVELQAKLAGMAAQVAPQALAYNKQSMDANKQGLDYRNQGNKVQGQQLAQLAGLGGMLNKSGIFDAAGRGLGGMFGGNQPTAVGMPESPGYRPSQNYGDEAVSEGDNFWDNW